MNYNSHMNLEPIDLNIAYDELMTWGSRLGMPLIPRIQERLPTIILEYALVLEQGLFEITLHCNVDLAEKVNQLFISNQDPCDTILP